jgi:NAD(P)-dependent dehydrogenase (short-subunit alcohol dehydrogenase family)
MANQVKPIPDEISDSQMNHSSRKVALVTGSTDGVGRLVAGRLADAGWHVIVHGRDSGRGERAVQEIQAAGKGTAEFIAADLSSLGAARSLAETLMSRHAHLELLISNAGIGTASGGQTRLESHDGHELRFAVNYLAGFVLTQLLLSTLKDSAPARIVVVASAGQQAIDFDDVMLRRDYSGVRAYRQSKLAQVMYSFDLAQELAAARVSVNCLHPATYMNTTMVRAAGVTPMSTVEQGAEAILNLALSPQLEGRTGLYYNGLRPARADPQAYDPDARARLRALSVQLTGLTGSRGA